MERPGNLKRVEPVRTCLGCRGRENKADLIRLVRGDAAIVVDVRQTAPGRGGYLHQRPECWEQALKRRVLSRAFGLADVDREALLGQLRAVAGDGGPA